MDAPGPRRIWCHDKGFYISMFEFYHDFVRCPVCGSYQPKYVESWYTGGQPCALLGKYCRNCGSELNNK